MKFKSAQIVVQRNEIERVESCLEDIRNILKECGDYVEGDCTDTTKYPGGEYDTKTLLRFLDRIEARFMLIDMVMK